MKMILFSFLTLFYLITFSNADFDKCTSIPSESPLKVAQTLNGQLKGECKIIPVSYSNNTKINSDVFSWLSIPYAEPPINKNRFKRPIPASNWSNIKNATELPKECIQLFGFGNRFSSEDCLYLNVYSRSDVYLNKNTSLQPVLVWIHGGGFTSGSTRVPLYEPSTIVAMSGIVVVAIQYRLHAFGFIRLEGTDATGNQGFLDQSLALKWVYENIRNFGGDPSKITIQGVSAGASSVSYQLFYPGSWPYFKNAIVQSAAKLSKLMLSSEDASRRAKDLMISLNCSSSLSNVDLLACAQNANPSLIPARVINFMPTLSYLRKEGFPSSGVDVFTYPIMDNIVFNQSIDSLLRTGQIKKCKIITGFTSDEFGFFLPLYWQLNETNNFGFTGFNFKNFEYLVNYALYYYPDFPLRLDSNIFDELVNAYFNLVESVKNLSYPVYLNYFIQLMSDFSFVCPNLELAESYANQQLDAYVYELKHRPYDSQLPSYLGTTQHADDQFYIFALYLSNKNASIPNETPFEEKAFTEKFLSYWFNFIKYEDPNYNKPSGASDFWQPFNKNLASLSADDKMKNGNYLLIQNSTSFTMVKDFSSHHCKTLNYTRNSAGINDSGPGFFARLFTKIKLWTVRFF